AAGGVTSGATGSTGHEFRWHAGAQIWRFMAPTALELTRSNQRNQHRFYAVLISFAVVLSSRSEEHTSELQSRFDIVCRLLLERQKKTVIMEAMKFPEPVIRDAIESTTQADQNRLATQLLKIAAEDAAVRASSDEETGPTTMQG